MNQQIGWRGFIDRRAIEALRDAECRLPRLMAGAPGLDERRAQDREHSAGLKGSGWYATDFKGGSKPAESKSSDASKDSSSKDGSKRQRLQGQKLQG